MHRWQNFSMGTFRQKHIVKVMKINLRSRAESCSTVYQVIVFSSKPSVDICIAVNEKCIQTKKVIAASPTHVPVKQEQIPQK